jgi:Domain of unknown function (DUF4747)
LNISANPHPEGIYIALLRRAADFFVRARGSDFAKITLPTQNRRFVTYWTGRILLWTEIDIAGSWLDIASGEELTPELKNAINIPPSAKPNYRSFDYAFDDERHLLYFESKNELGQSLGPAVARRIFMRLLSPELQRIEVPEVEVTLVPETQAVERILALPGLRTLYIKIVRANPDVSPQARQRVLGRLEEAHARRAETTLVKSADALALTPGPEIQEMAAVAAENGEVRGEGRDAEGHKLEVSTVDLPRRIYVGVDRGATFLGRLFSALRR